MSELVNNLQSIYNIKLQIKDVLQTDSDLFEDYPDIIEQKISEGGGSSVDPFYDYATSDMMIMNEESSADYVGSTISENFNITLDANDELVEAVEWDENVVIDVEGTDVDKVIHVIVNGDPHEIFDSASNIAQALEDYPVLYESIFPILENATLTASEDPSNDGYDYLLEGDLYAWNLHDNNAGINEITGNGFAFTSGDTGANVNVVPTGTGNYHIFTTNKNYSSLTPTNDIINMHEYSNTYQNVVFHNLTSTNWMDPITQEETTNSYFQYIFTNDNNQASLSGINSGGESFEDASLYKFYFVTNTLSYTATINRMGTQLMEYVEYVDPEDTEQSYWYWRTTNGSSLYNFSTPIEVSGTDNLFCTCLDESHGFQPILYVNGVPANLTMKNLDNQRYYSYSGE